MWLIAFMHDYGGSLSCKRASRPFLPFPPRLNRPHPRAPSSSAALERQSPRRRPSRACHPFSPDQPSTGGFPFSRSTPPPPSSASFFATLRVHPLLVILFSFLLLSSSLFSTTRIYFQFDLRRARIFLQNLTEREINARRKLI